MNIIWIFTIILLCILEGAEVDLFIPSFPEMQEEFHISPFMVELTLSVNFISYCFTSLIVGALGDRYGRKCVIFYCLIIFIIGSILCVVTESYYIILLGRFLQGIGAAGPAILCYVIISDKASGTNQMKLVGLLNGVINFSIAFAPIIGSYINLYFGWRGNFTVLLALGIVCVIMLHLFIEKDQMSAKISHELNLFAGYLNILQSRQLLFFIICMSFLFTPYWVFIGIAPLLYMEDLGITLEKFGFYQGSVTLSFSLLSVLYGYIIPLMGKRVMLIISFWVCLMSVCFIILLGIWNCSNPLLITGVMILYSIGVVGPGNILYYDALAILEAEKGKVAATILAIRLALTAIGLEVAGYFYQGNFRSISVILSISIIIGVYNFYLLFKNKWV